MGTFNLVQRGAFIKGNHENASLTGCTGIVRLENMANPRFADETIPKAFRRVMKNYPEYNVYSTDIKSPDGKELKLFCHKDSAEATISAVRSFIEEPWALADMAFLTCVTRGVNLYINFWWAVEQPAEGILTDWMAFLEPNEEIFKTAIANDYNRWWCRMSEEERESEYKKALE